VSDQIEVWERIGDESPKSHAIFAHYRDEGPGRSLRKTARGTEFSFKWVGELSAKHSWQMRVRAYDAAMDRQRLVDNQVAQRKMVDRHARVAELAQSKALERLQALGPNELTPAEATRLLEVGVRIERLSRGAPTEHVATSDGDSVWEEELEGDELAGELKGFLLGLEQAESNKARIGEVSVIMTIPRTGWRRMLRSVVLSVSGRGRLRGVSVSG